MKLCKRVITLLIILFLYGCSSTSYKKEMDAFKNATTGAKSVFEGLITIEQGSAEKIEFLENLNEIDQSNIIALKLSNECAVLDKVTTNSNLELLQKAEKCRIQYYGKSIEDKDLVSPDISAPQGIKLLKLITEYSISLADLAGGEDIESINESAEKLRASVLSLATEVNKSVSGGEISAIADPITALVQTIFLNYLNHKRFIALRAAVNEAHAPLITSIEILKQQASSAYLSAVLLDYQELNYKVSRFKVEDKQKSVDQAYSIQNEGIKLQNLVKNNPVKIFDKMLAAHVSIKKSLDDPKNQRDHVFQAITEFRDSVESIIKALEKQRS